MKHSQRITCLHPAVFLCSTIQISFSSSFSWFFLVAVFLCSLAVHCSACLWQCSHYMLSLLFSTYVQTSSIFFKFLFALAQSLCQFSFMVLDVITSGESRSEQVVELTLGSLKFWEPFFSPHPLLSFYPDVLVPYSSLCQKCRSSTLEKMAMEWNSSALRLTLTTGYDYIQLISQWFCCYVVIFVYCKL